MSKPTIIPNWHYQKPTKGGYRSLRKLLKYVSYRESPVHRPVDLSDRWTDCGLGAGWKAVYAAAGEQAGPYVLAHHLVIAPAPDLMALVPEDIRAEVVRFEDLVAAGSEAEAKKRGAVRTEGKQYVVQDGDILNILFNV